MANTLYQQTARGSSCAVALPIPKRNISQNSVVRMNWMTIAFPLVSVGVVIQKHGWICSGEGGTNPPKVTASHFTKGDKAPSPFSLSLSATLKLLQPMPQRTRRKLWPLSIICFILHHLHRDSNFGLIGTESLSTHHGRVVAKKQKAALNEILTLWRYICPLLKLLPFSCSINCWDCLPHSRNSSSSLYVPLNRK